MTDKILLLRLRPAVVRMRHLRMLVGSTAGLAIAALITAALMLYARKEPYASSFAYERAKEWALFGGFAVFLLGMLAGWLLEPRPAKVARQLEKLYPDLEGRLITALQQVPDEEGEFRFLQEHLFTETLHHSTVRDWNAVVRDSSLRWMHVAQVVAFVAFLGLWWQLPGHSSSERALAAVAPGLVSATVTPGDTELEKGSNLVLLARFENAVPGTVDLVTGETAASEKRVPLTRSLSDPVFGGTVTDVMEPITYRVAWEGGESQKFKVRVFEFPKLERSDVTLTYPEYTKQAAKHIEDMRHTSAVEGTRVDLDLTLNKPVASAVLEPRKAKEKKDAKDAKDSGDAPAPLKLETSPDKALATLRGFVPAKSARYELVLTDADGRRSRQAVPFSFDVVPNKVPEMKLAAPKGDQKPSALQELLFTGTVWDDFGVVASGLEVTTPGGETVTLDLGKDVPGRETRAFQQLLRFEDMNAVPDQLFAWHAWADDIGPDGKVRRTRGDLFYAEVRAFEEVFRQGESTDSEQQKQQQKQQKGQNQGPAAKLAELQKQIINATWKLQRTTSNITSQSAGDIQTVLDSQKDASAQATEAAEKAGDDPVAGFNWKVVLQQMEKAVEHLDKATAAPAELPAALPPEQSAYQALLKLRAHEFEVSQSKKQQQGGGGQQSESEGTQRQQEQLNQLDLAKEEDRYETQREAQAQQSAERREQMQVMNRLKELAQRQQDVNEKLKELQTALNEAKTEQEKEDARRKLKRLEEEQRRMLADADELSQKMEQRQNQSEAGEQQQKLDQARENMEQAADATAKGEAGKALASGTRAQEQMQQMRDEMRKQSAGAFADELREMRAEARDLARKQEEITKQLKEDTPGAPDPAEPKGTRKEEAPSLAGGPDPADIAKALDKQEQRTEHLVKRATELSEQAEPSEPLLSRQIYETARQFAQDDAGAVKETQQEMLRDRELSQSQFDNMRRLLESEKSGKALRLTADLVQKNQKQQAGRTGERAREGLDRMRQGVEKAAESVLGDDTAAIRLAEAQLQAAADAVQKEIEQQQQKEGGDPKDGQQPQPGKGAGKSQETAQTPREGQPKDGSQPAPGEGKQPNGEQPGEGKGQGQVAQNQDQPKDGQRQGRGRGRQQTNPQGGQPREQQPGEQQPGDQSQVAQQQDGQPQEGQPGEQPGQGGQPGEGAEQGQNRESASTADGPNSRQRQRENANGGGGGGGPQLGFESRRPVANRKATASPLTGNGFNNWSDSLREAEEMVDQPDLRNGIAAARERARQMRFDMKRDLKKPDWAVVQLEILKPLVEVRQRLSEELARRDSDKALVPVDRDPVPAQFTENVRRYYEQLGKDQ